MNRRSFFKLTGKSALAAWAGSSLLLNGCHTEEDMIGKPNWIVEGSFDTPLFLPQKISGHASLVAQPSSASLIKGSTTNTLAYGHGVLGPTIEVMKGETISVSLQNKLTEHTNIHWHGLVLPADMDGHPEDLAVPDGSFNYQLPIHQRAGTYWYHPHPHTATARQVFMGLAGMFLVRDAEESALNLPGDIYEVPIIIQDKRFSGSSLQYAPSDDEIMTGYLGEQILVNGVQAPVLSVETRWYRLRLLNGSTARVYQLGFSNQPFYLIGTDGGLLSTPEKITTLMLAPGERADVLINFNGHTIGSELYLESYKFSEFNLQGRQEFKMMKFRVDKSSTDSFILPTNLSAIPVLSALSATRIRKFDISSLVGTGGHGAGSKHGINGMTYENDHIAFSVEAGTTEIWEFDNLAGEEIHPMHIHGVQFQVLGRQGGRNQVFPSEKGWKDTVMVMPQEKVSVIMAFPEYRGKFVFHCHNLEHEDDGMMLNYEIS
jgi:blue copper oxidase